jgi:hypothetical protein
MNTNTVANDALKRAAERLTPEFKQEALSAGWPADIVYQLSVEEINGDLQVSIPDEIRNKVDDLEYGEVNGTSNRVIYRFEQSHSEGLDDIFEIAFEDVVSRLGAFN